MNRSQRHLLNQATPEMLRDYQKAVHRLLASQTPEHEHYKENVKSLEEINQRIARLKR